MGQPVLGADLCRLLAYMGTYRIAHINRSNLLLPYVSAFVFGLAGRIIGLLGIAVLITYSVRNGITLLVIAFLVSPVGIPMAAVWLLGKVQAVRYAIQDWVY